MSSPRAGTVVLTVAGTGETIPLTPQRLVIAGYTARDQSAVQAHIDELAHIGVAPPPRVPMFYEVPADLATTGSAVLVDGAETSGEIEPVLLCADGGRLYLGLGSDHTDREIEKRDIAESKASAPKPLGPDVLPLDRAAADWDDIEVLCRLDGAVYQQGSLAAMLPPDVLLAKLAATGRPLDVDGLMFCGTFPLIGGTFVFGTTYELELRLPDGTSLSHTYDVKQRSS